MIILLPIFNINQDTFYFKHNDVNLFINNILNYLKSTDHDFIITTDNRDVASVFQDSFQTFCIPFANSEIQNELIPGSNASLTFLIERSTFSFHDYVLILNYKNLFIDNKLLSDVDCAHAISNDCLISTVYFEDNPTQLSLPSKSLINDVLVRIDKQHHPASFVNKVLPSHFYPSDFNFITCHKTHPFFVDWFSYDLDSLNAHNYYSKIYSENSYDYCNIIPLTDCLPDHLFIHSIYQHESLKSGRRLYFLDTEIPDMYAVSFFQNEFSSTILALSNNTDCRIFASDYFFHHHCRVFICPFASEEMLLNDFLCIDSYTSPKESFIANGNTYYGPLASFPLKDHYTGFFIQCYQHTFDNNIHYLIPAEGNDWFNIPFTGFRVNKDERNLIVGRQDFPEFQQIDGSFVLCTPEDYFNLPGRLANNVFQPFYLGDKSLICETIDDLYYYIALSSVHTT